MMPVKPEVIEAARELACRYRTPTLLEMSDEWDDAMYDMCEAMNLDYNSEYDRDIALYENGCMIVENIMNKLTRDNNRCILCTLVRPSYLQHNDQDCIGCILTAKNHSSDHKCTIDDAEETWEAMLESKNYKELRLAFSKRAKYLEQLIKEVTNES